jgi:hypothetical protein
MPCTMCIHHVHVHVTAFVVVKGDRPSQDFCSDTTCSLWISMVDSNDFFLQTLLENALSSEILIGSLLQEYIHVATAIYHVHCYSSCRFVHLNRIKRVSYISGMCVHIQYYVCLGVFTCNSPTTAAACQNIIILGGPFDPICVHAWP